MSLKRRWATIAETAEHLGTGDRTVRKMIAEGRLPAYRNGPRIIRLDLNEVDEAMTPMNNFKPSVARHPAKNTAQPKASESTRQRREDPGAA